MGSKKRWWYVHPESSSCFTSDVKPSLMVPGPDGFVQYLGEQLIQPEDIEEACQYLESEGDFDSAEAVRDTRQ